MGTIIVGYQGIGKSTLSRRYDLCIDLESSCFKNRLDRHNKRPDDWYIYYCQIAEDLARQGYTVFVSSHKEVRDFLREYCRNTKVICIYPCLEIAEEWISKLEARFKQTRLIKDELAWINAKEKYAESITDLMNCGIPHIEISHIDYDLVYYVSRAISMNFSDE